MAFLSELHLRVIGWLRRLGWRRGLLIAGGAIVVLIAMRAFPLLFGLYWGYGGYKNLFYNELHFSAAQSEFFAVAASFFAAIFLVPMALFTARAARYRKDPGRLALAFIAWMVLYGSTPLLHIFLGSNACFGQSSGQPLKWYVKDTTGKLVFSDGPGFDQNGVQKKPVTVEICETAEAQKKGLTPHEIVADPKAIEFFDPQTGDARVWFSRNSDGLLVLFDSVGFDPLSGQLLAPVTRDVVTQFEAQVANKAESDRVAANEAKRLAAAQAASQAVGKAAQDAAKAKEDLAARFGTASYPAGVIVVGVVPQRPDDVSTQAARSLRETLVAGVRARNSQTDDFRPGVYESGDFQAMLAGNEQALTESGLAQRMRAAVFASATADCHASDVVGVTTCSMSVQIRIVSTSAPTTFQDISETAAGTTRDGALNSAAAQVRDRHPELLAGV